jgi:hypothetical protein
MRKGDGSLLTDYSVFLRFSNLWENSAMRTVSLHHLSPVTELHLLRHWKGIPWPTLEEEDQADETLGQEVLRLPLRLGIRRARIRVEILGQETDSQVKYELFQRLNSGGAHLSEQELRNCVVISISKPAFDNIRSMAADESFLRLASVGAPG